MKIVFLISLCLSLFSCNMTKHKENLNEEKNYCYLKNNINAEVPDWMCNPNTESHIYISAIGESYRNGESFGLAVQKAVSSARESLLYNIQDQLRSYIRKVCIKLNISYSNIELLLYNSNNIFMLQELKTSKIYKQHTLDNDHIYLLVGYVKSSYLEYISNIINKTYVNDKEAWDKVLGEYSIIDFQKSLLEELEK